MKEYLMYFWGLLIGSLGGFMSNGNWSSYLLFTAFILSLTLLYIIFYVKHDLNEEVKK